MTLTAGSNASLEHLVQHALEGIILQRSRHTLLVTELLVDLIVLAVAVLLAAHDDAVVGRQCLLKADANTKPDDSGERAVGDGGRDLDGDGGDGVGVRDGAGDGRGRDVDVGEVDDGELAERDGMLGV